MPKFKASATVCWEFEAADLSKAKKQFDDLLCAIELESDDDYKGYRDTDLEEVKDATPKQS